MISGFLKANAKFASAVGLRHDKSIWSHLPAYLSFQRPSPKGEADARHGSWKCWVTCQLPGRKAETRLQKKKCDLGFSPQEHFPFFGGHTCQPPCASSSSGFESLQAKPQPSLPPTLHRALLSQWPIITSEAQVIFSVRAQLLSNKHDQRNIHLSKACPLNVHKVQHLHKTRFSPSAHYTGLFTICFSSFQGIHSFFSFLISFNYWNFSLFLWPTVLLCCLSLCLVLEGQK